MFRNWQSWFFCKILHWLFWSTPTSRPNKAGLTVRPYIRPSVHKKFIRFQQIWFVDRGRWEIHNSMPYDPIQGQGHRGPKSYENGWFQTISPLACMWSKHYYDMNYDTSRQYLNFNRTEFWYSSSFGVTWPLNLGVPPLANKFWLLVSIIWLSHTVLLYCFNKIAHFNKLQLLDYNVQVGFWHLVRGKLKYACIIRRALSGFAECCNVQQEARWHTGITCCVIVFAPHCCRRWIGLTC